VWLDTQQSFECFVDADSCGNRDPMYSEDPNSAKRRMGCVIMYCGCPVLCASRLQSAFSISTMDSKTVTLLPALRHVIPVMDLWKELQDRVYNVEGNLYIKCTLFADNSGVFEQANTIKNSKHQWATF
jgi:hypothetical protein